MIRTYLLIFFLAICCSIQASNLNEDSLYQILDTAKSAKTIARINYNLSLVYQESDPEKALSSVRKGIELAKQNDLDSYLGLMLKMEADLLYKYYDKDSALVLYEEVVPLLENTPLEYLLSPVYELLAYFKAIAGDLETAEIYFLKSIEMAKKQNNRESLARGYLNYASSLAENERFEKSLEYYYKALKVETENEVIDSLRIAHVWENIGQIHYHMSDFKTGLEFQFKSLSIFRNRQNLDMMTKVMVTIGNIYAAQKMNDSALYYYQQAQPLVEQTSNIVYRYLIRLNTATILKQKGRYLESLEAYKESEVLFEKLNQNTLETKKWKSEQYSTISNLLLKLGRRSEAKNYALQSLEFAEELDKVELRYKAHSELANYYFDINDFQKALAHQKSYYSLRDSIFSLEKKSRIEDLETKYQTEVKEREIADLQAEKAMQAILSGRKSKQITLWLSALAALFFIAGIIVLYFSQKRKKAKEIAELEKENQEAEIQELIQKQTLKSIDAMIEGQENERERIARDLHDRLGSTMSMIKLHFSEVIDQLEEIQEKNLSNYLMVNDLVDEAIVEVRRISHNMAAGTLMEYGLVPALYELKTTIETSQRIKLHLHIFNLDFRLKSTAEINLYRVIQEMVNNTLKHANATEIDISLTRREDALSLIYSDNGKGMEIDQATFSFGMGQKNIKSRIEKLGGEMHVYSEIGKGMNYDIEIPLS